jgi:hypothetical protein
MSLVVTTIVSGLEDALLLGHQPGSKFRVVPFILAPEKPHCVCSQVFESFRFDSVEIILSLARIFLDLEPFLNRLALILGLHGVVDGFDTP